MRSKRTRALVIIMIKNIKNLYVLLLLLFGLSSSGAYAEVLELGESQLHGKKDQPEAMTFVSRAPLDEGSQPTKLMDAYGEIKKEIENKIFNLVYSD